MSFSTCAVDSRSCERNSDCFQKEFCEEGRCLERPNPSNNVANNVNNGSQNNNSTPQSDCDSNQDCEFGFCKKPEQVCQCDLGQHQCEQRCLDSSDAQFCSGCSPCPTDERGTNTCSADGMCSISCTPPFQRCSAPNCPRLCVECSKNENCSEDAPLCLDHECKGCELDDDCSAFPSKPICGGGKCVQCLESRALLCQGNACDPASNTCTQTKIRSQADCHPCLSDTECERGSACVKMNFGGPELAGGYCLTKFTGSTCQRPYPVRVSKVSLSTGLSAEYCSISEDILTCKSLLDWGSTCRREKDDDCGLVNLEDGKCRLMRGTYRCSHACSTEDDCVNAAFCAGSCLAR